MLRTALVGIAAVALVACAGVRDSSGAVDDLALRALDLAYVEGWLANGSAAQEQALLALFSDQAVIIPGRGTEPRVGLPALREFWFPAGSPPTNVTEFKHAIDQVTIRSGIGVVRGRSVLRFEFDGKDYAQAGNFLFIADQGDDDRWRISQLIWNNRTLE